MGVYICVQDPRSTYRLKNIEVHLTRVPEFRFYQTDNTTPLLYRHGGKKKKIINNKQICATFLYDCSFTGHETLYTILYRNSGLARIDSFKVWQTLLLAEGMDHIIFDKIIIDRDDNNKDILFSALQRVCIFLFRSIYSRINDPRQIRNISSRYILSHISKFICSLISVGNRYMNK